MLPPLAQACNDRSCVAMLIAGHADVWRGCMLHARITIGARVMQCLHLHRIAHDQCGA